jgi:hypothetical protein
MSERMREGMMEFGRERHEKAAREVVERLRGEGYFHEGESATIVLPPEGQKEKWVARCDVDALNNPPDDPERKKRFPSGDPLYDGFVAAGYRVDVMPDYESSGGPTDRAEYYLYEKEK